jgi:hypothetical protein
MKQLFLIASLLLLFPPAGSGQVKVIFDTDMAGDRDDCGATAVLHALADLGEAEILGMGVNIAGGAKPWTPQVLDAINTWYGRPDIPIGIARKGVSMPDSYGEWLLNQGFQQDIGKEGAVDVVDLYRRLLAESPDKSVVLISVGFLASVNELLVSAPDKHSPLNGRDLIRKKIKLWSCMGGTYPKGSEANLQDWRGLAKNAIDNWPTPIIFSGGEIGCKYGTGECLLETPKSNPVRRIYRYMSSRRGNNMNHCSFDQTSVLAGIRDPELYWDLTPSGTNTVRLDKDRRTHNAWKATPDSGHRYLLPKDNIREVTKIISDLICAPPAKSATVNRGTSQLETTIQSRYVTVTSEEPVAGFVLTVEREEEVYSHEPADNGSGPMWCHGNTSVVRVGNDVFASGIETINGVKPLNNCKPFLLRQTRSGWDRIYTDDKRTREPSPLAMYRSGQVFLSTNPTLTPPGTYNGPAQPRVLEFLATSPNAAPQSLEPQWAGQPTFTEHSYRSLTTDGENGELLLMQNIAYAHAEWAFRDRDNKWSAQGKLVWPWGSEYDDPKPIRLCYPTVALKDRRFYFCGEGDVTEPNHEWRDYKRKLTGREWDYVFRQLFFTWSDDITTGKFHNWVEIANREETAGNVGVCDLYVAPDEDVFILWQERALDTRLREKFFPDAKQRYSLECAILRDGEVVRRTTLAEAGDGLGDLVPGKGRFHVTEDNRLLVLYYQGGAGRDGKRVSKNWIVELDNNGNPGRPITVPLKRPITQFFTATVRAGCRPTDIIDVFGQVGNTMRYAKIRLNSSEKQ